MPFPILPSNGPSGYQISRSVRTRASASAYFSRTPASASNRQTWTWSAWIKRGAIGSQTYLFGAGPSSATFIRFESNDTLTFYSYSGGTLFQLTTSQVFRDPSAWYHFVIVLDTTNATSSNRARIYINGVQVTAFSTSSYPSLNASYDVNTANLHTLMAYNSPSNYTDGYITEVNFIDGQALTPSSFGQYNTLTGVWQPIKYGGAYGTNGFYLNFSDNSGATATTIGKDYSGNGNNWTPNNISVTAGSTYDSMIDVPTQYTDGGNGRGNYCTLSPLTLKNGTLSSGNIEFAPSGNNNAVWSTFAVNTGKWYWEVTKNSGDMALFLSQQPIFTGSYDPGFSDTTSLGMLMYYSSGGTSANRFMYNNTATAFPTGFGDDDVGTVYSFILDFGAATIKVRRNNDSGTEASFSMSAALTALPLFIGYSVTTTWPAGSFSYNFGQRPFSYTPPSGYLALNTFNLSTPTIGNGADYMAATTYTGNGSTLTVTNGGNNTLGTTFKPDFVWIKDRTGANNHCLFDSVRGVYILLNSNSTAADQTFSTSLTSFNSNGFSLGSYGNVNLNSSSNYIAWQWQAGQGTTSSNTSGSITSTVSVNATAGFSVVTYTGNNSTATIGHGLGVAPSMIIIKDRLQGSGYNWNVYHASLGNTKRIFLDTTTDGNTAGVWNNTSPTSTVFTVTNNAAVNGTDTYVAYCWAAVAGYSAFGSYTGNGSTDGTFVYLGFRPRWLLIKRTDTTGDWNLIDTARSTYNQTDSVLWANLSNADSAGQNTDILSNGFKLRSTGLVTNASGGTYIYAAFAENPFKYALAR